MSEKENVDVMDLLDIKPEVKEKEDKQASSYGRVNITLYRDNAWHKDKKTGEEIPYPEAGNYDRMIKNAGCGDNPALLIQVCDKLLGFVKTGVIKRV